jgi:molecular chaperone DnaK
VYARPAATPQGPGTPTATPARTATPLTVAGTAVLTEQAVPGEPEERMNGLVSLGTGGTGAVAVGGSDADDSPRAWRLEGGSWTPAEVAESPLVGAMNAVARLPGRRGDLVAVGWVAARPAAGAPTPTGSARWPAVWTSPDGASWTMAGAGDLGTGVDGIGELYAVVVDPGGGLVATGVDWTKDPRSGDGALLRSADGKAWQAVPVTGLDGLGPTALHGLLVEPSGLVAVGSRLGADSTEAVVWTSPDGVAWTETVVLEHAGPGAAEAAGVVRSADGQLLVAGTSAEIDGTPVPAVWAGPGPDALRPYAVQAPGAAVGGIAVVADAVSAVGSRPGDDSRVPAAWIVALQPG